jgi:hypothetical protein
MTLLTTLHLRTEIVSMGIDFLDITFRMEKEFQIKFDGRKFFGSLDPAARDVTVEQLHRFLIEQIKSQRMSRRTDSPFFWCNRCGHPLCQPSEGSFCRICGMSIRFDAQTWPALVRILVQALSIEPEMVKPQSLLKRDLGLS